MVQVKADALYAESKRLEAMADKLIIARVKKCKHKNVWCCSEFDTAAYFNNYREFRQCLDCGLREYWGDVGFYRALRGYHEKAINQTPKTVKAAFRVNYNGGKYIVIRWRYE